MRKTLSIALMLALLAGAMAMPAEAAKKKKNKKKKKAAYVRVIEGTYDNPAPGIGGVVTFTAFGGTIAFPTLPNEAYVSVEVKDAVGPQTYFGLAQEDTDGDGFGEIIAGGCTKTEEPLPITGGLEHTVTITTGPGAEAPDCPGIATTGTVKITLTETPTVPAAPAR
jgi:hypothetical protein